MGITVSVYRNSDRYIDCSLNGITSRHSQLVVVNAEGPAEPDESTPAVLLENHYKGYLRIVPAVRKHNGEWARQERWWMFGGNFVYTSDSRFAEACRRLLKHEFYGAVAVHDRQEGGL